MISKMPLLMLSTLPLSSSDMQSVNLQPIMLTHGTSELIAIELNAPLALQRMALTTWIPSSFIFRLSRESCAINRDSLQSIRLLQISAPRKTLTLIAWSTRRSSHNCHPCHPCLETWPGSTLPEGPGCLRALGFTSQGKAQCAHPTPLAILTLNMIPLPVYRGTYCYL